MIKLLFILIISFNFSTIILAQELNVDSALLKEIIDSTYDFSKYGEDENISTIERLNRTENDINRLKELAVKYPNEPRIYIVIGYLYSNRDTLLKREIIYKDRSEWFSLPVAQENLQGIRDNCVEAIRRQELRQGISLEKNMLYHCLSSPVMTIQFLERAYKALHNMLPDVIECKESDDPYDECMTEYKKDIVLRDYLDVQSEYIVYGFFDDAERLNKEITQVSEEGKTASIEKAARIERARQNFNPDKYKDDIDYALMQPGGTPKPITIRGADAIAENHKAVLEASHRSKAAETSSSSSSVQQSSSAASSAPAVPTQKTAEIDREKLLWIGFAVGVALLTLLVLVRRRKS